MSPGQAARNPDYRCCHDIHNDCTHSPGERILSEDPSACQTDIKTPRNDGSQECSQQQPTWIGVPRSRKIASNQIAETCGHSAVRTVHADHTSEIAFREAKLLMSSKPARIWFQPQSDPEYSNQTQSGRHKDQSRSQGNSKLSPLLFTTETVRVIRLGQIRQDPKSELRIPVRAVSGNFSSLCRISEIRFANPAAGVVSGRILH